MLIRIVCRLTLVAALLTPSTVRAVNLFVVPQSSTVQAGAQFWFDSCIQNPSSETLRGQILLRAAIANAVILAVASNNLGILCGRVTGSDTDWECKGDYDLAPGGQLVIRSTISVPSQLKDGTKVTHTSTVQAYGYGVTANGVSIVKSRVSNAPQLSIEIERDVRAYPGLPFVASVVRYRFKVTNIGSAPTTGEVDVDINITSQGLEPEFIEQGWGPAGSLLRFTRSTPLDPGQSFKTTDIIFDLTRGAYQLTALAAGGGSPPDEEKENWSSETRFVLPDEFNPPPLSVRGRPRP